MGFVTFRMAVEVILVTGNRIIPIHHVYGSIWSDFHVDRPEIAVTGTDQWFPPYHLESSTVLGYGEAAYTVSLVIPDDEFSLHFLRQVGSSDALDSAVASGLTDARQAQTALSRDRSGRKVRNTPGSVGNQRLAKVVEGNSPRVARTHKVVQKAIQA